MHLSLVLATAAGVAASGVSTRGGWQGPYQGRGGVQNCSATSSTPCQCPPGTEYQESVTFSVIGAAAADIEKVTNDFYNTEWYGAVPWNRQGPNNTPAVSIRTTEFPTNVGTYNMSELLTEQQATPDGFIQKFEHLSSQLPLQYDTGNGSFGGHWVTLEAKEIFEHETLMIWSVYACYIGHPLDLAGFHEFALKNAVATLEEQGQASQGITKEPFSIQDF